MAPGVRSYLHPLSHHEVRHRRNLRPGRWPSGMPWTSPGPRPCPGRTGCRRRKNRKGVPLWKVNPKPGLSPPPLEGDSVSDVSMVDEGLLQCDSDMIIEEEREEGMETDAPLDSTIPVPLKKKAMSEDLEAGDHEDCCSQTSEESTNQNLPMTLILMRTSFWGCQLMFPFLGDTPMTLLLLSFPREKMTCKTSDICNSNGQQ